MDLSRSRADYPAYFNSTRIAEFHRVNDFRSDNKELDSWLQASGLRADKTGISRVNVWVPVSEPDRIVAYYAIAPTQIAAANGLPRAATGGFSSVPGWLLGKLAVDVNFQGNGIGSEVLLDALERIVSAAATAGGRLVIVDPIDIHAMRFYEKFGFRSFGPTSENKPARQFIPIKDIVASLSAPQSFDGKL